MERNDTANEILFLSWLKSDYSRSAVILNSRYVEKFNHKFLKVRSGVRLPVDLVRVVLENRNKNVIYFVCSPCLTIGIWLRIFCRKRIILDAGWPLTDNTHKGYLKIHNFFKSLRIGLIERLAFRASNMVFLESVAQANRVSLDFNLDPKKLFVGYTGLNEHEFEVESAIPRELFQISNKSKQTTILFRGKINEETGLHKIKQLISYVEDATFIICSSNLPEDFPDLKNLIKINREISFAEMKYLYEISDVAIGQLGTSTRLTRTIPHKAFEAAYFGKPYLGLNQQALKELFYEKNSSLLFVSFDELQSFLINHSENHGIFKEIGLNAKRIYDKDFNQELLSEKCIDLILK
jgi:hypothetical protein